MQQVLSISSNSSNHGVVFFSNPENPTYYWGYKTGENSASEVDRDALPEDTSDVGSPEDGLRSELLAGDTLFVVFAQKTDAISDMGYTVVPEAAESCSTGMAGEETYYINQELMIDADPPLDGTYKVLKVILLDAGGNKKGKGTMVMDPPISVN